LSVISLEDEAIVLLSRQYIVIVRRLIVEIGLPTDNYSISKSSMELAFSEAAKDIEIMSIRRQPKRGISCSKIAGIIAFRLARFSPIHLSGKALNDEKSLKLNRHVGSVVVYL